MKTTLNKIKDNSPCIDGWKKLLKHLGKTKSDDESLSILTILKSNGLDDALWCLRAVDGEDKKIRLYAVWCARQVQHLMKDKRSIDALDVAERFANGLATDEELENANDVASNVSKISAWSAAWFTTNNAAWSAANNAAWAAERNDASDSTRLAQSNKLIEICAK